MFEKLIHKIKHLLGWYSGTCYSFYSKGGKLMMSFKCGECGKLSGIHCVEEMIDDMMVKELKKELKK